MIISAFPRPSEVAGPAFTIIGRCRNVRRPANIARLLGRNKRLSAGDTLLEVEFALPACFVDLERLVEQHSGVGCDHKGGRIDLDCAPRAEVEQLEEVDRLGVELDACGIGIHRDAFHASCDFDSMAVLAP